MIYVFVSEVVSIFSKILTWIFFGGQKDTFASPTQLLEGGARPSCPTKSTPMLLDCQSRGLGSNSSQEEICVEISASAVMSIPTMSTLLVEG